MYYEDFSKYEYQILGGRELRYVDWIEPGKSFPTGAAPEGLVTKFNLIRDSRYPVCYRFAITRGYHYCGLCDSHCGEGRPKSHGEVMIPDSENPNLFYSANELFGHYIERHGYLPPTEFIKSVLAVDLEKPFDAIVMFDSMLLSRESMKERYECEAEIRAKTISAELSVGVQSLGMLSGEYFRYRKWLDENPV